MSSEQRWMLVCESETLIKGVLSDLRPLGEVRVARSGMDSVPMFSEYLADGVIVHETQSDIPPNMLAQVFRELSPGVHLWLAGDDPNQAAAREMGFDGAVAAPLRVVDVMLIQDPPDVDHTLDQGWTDETIHEGDTDIHWDPRRMPDGPLELAGHELSGHRRFHHKGHLHIKGSVHNLGELTVSGSIKIDGDLVNVGVRCGDFLAVKGNIKDCREPGIFTRGFIDAGDIHQSLVVCGDNLFLTGSCTNASIHVVKRLIGKTEQSMASGGQLRVGEYLELSALGDDQQTETLVELAPELFHQPWIHAWRRLQKISDLESAPQEIDEDSWPSLDTFRRLARLHTQKLHPGITVRIGEHEDYLFEPSGGVTICLGEKRRRTTVVATPD